MTPRGRPLTQARIRDLANGPGVTILCGRFEGFDERIFEARDIEPVSIGDYVLSGGEMGALVLLDACIRLLPGVMGAASSGVDESFEGGLLESRTIPDLSNGKGARSRGVAIGGSCADRGLAKAGGRDRYTAKAAGSVGAPCRCSGPVALWRAT